jgi:hypothetical protein
MIDLFNPSGSGVGPGQALTVMGGSLPHVELSAPAPGAWVPRSETGAPVLSWSDPSDSE